MSEDIQVVIEGEEQRGDPVASLKGQLTKLKSTTAALSQRATAAEAEATRARVRVSDLEKQVVSKDGETIKAGLDSVNAVMNAAKAELKQAIEEGDADKVVAANVKIANAASEAAQLRQAEQELKNVKVAEPSPVESADPVEQAASRMSPKSAAWVREHPDCITDPRKNALMMAGHHEALANGFSVDSDEYFETIEGKFKAPERKATKIDKDDDVEAEEDFTTGRRPVAPVAPGATAGGSGGNGARQTVKLTAAEAASATDGTLVWNYDDPSDKKAFKKGDPIGVKEFARRKAEMTKQGVYDRTFVDS